MLVISTRRYPENGRSRRREDIDRDLTANIERLNSAGGLVPTTGNRASPEVNGGSGGGRMV